MRVKRIPVQRHACASQRKRLSSIDRSIRSALPTLVYVFASTQDDFWMTWLTCDFENLTDKPHATVVSNPPIAFQSSEFARCPALTSIWPLRGSSTLCSVTILALSFKKFQCALIDWLLGISPHKPHFLPNILPLNPVLSPRAALYSPDYYIHKPRGTQQNLSLSSHLLL